jgi:hypothetical protein
MNSFPTDDSSGQLALDAARQASRAREWLYQTNIERAKYLEDAIWEEVDAAGCYRGSRSHPTQ